MSRCGQQSCTDVWEIRRVRLLTTTCRLSVQRTSKRYDKFLQRKVPGRESQVDIRHGVASARTKYNTSTTAWLSLFYVPLSGRTDGAEHPCGQRDHGGGDEDSPHI